MYTHSPAATTACPLSAASETVKALPLRTDRFPPYRLPGKRLLHANHSSTLALTLLFTIALLLVPYSICCWTLFVISSKAEFYLLVGELSYALIVFLFSTDFLTTRISLRQILIAGSRFVYKDSAEFRRLQSFIHFRSFYESNVFT